MNDRYDVIIVGAGPAGAQCARNLAERGYDVIVLETEAEDEFPAQSNKSTGGTFASMMTSFGIPDDVVMHATDSVVVESPNNYLVQDQPGSFWSLLISRNSSSKIAVKKGRNTVLMPV